MVAYLWIRNTTRNHWKFDSSRSVLSLAALLFLYFAPWYYGKTVLKEYSVPASTASLRVGFIQPDIDPFEKWGVGGEPDPVGKQLGIHLSSTRLFVKDSVDLVIWCETAIPSRILSAGWRGYWQNLRLSLDSIGLPVLTGFPYQEIIDSSKASATAQKIGHSNLYSEDYNSVMLVVPHEPVREVYKKIKLVPFAENSLREHRSSCSAVTSYICGFTCYFTHHLRAHVF